MAAIAFTTHKRSCMMTPNNRSRILSYMARATGTRQAIVLCAKRDCREEIVIGDNYIMKRNATAKYFHTRCARKLKII